MLIVNAINFNTDQTLLCISTNNGFRLYNVTSFALVSNTTDINTNNIGNIAKCITLSTSSLIAYINKDISHRNCLYFWSESLSQKIAAIVLHKPITNFTLNLSVIGIELSETNSYLLFHINDLKYITSIEDVKASTCNCVVHTQTQCITLAHVSNLNRNYIRIFKFKYESTTNNNVIKSYAMISINSGFNDIQVLQLTTSFVIVSNEYGNKIHIYSLLDMTLKHCLFLGYFQYTLTNVCVDVKEKFILLCTNSKYIKVFNLKTSTALYKGKCGCAERSDGDIMQQHSHRQRTLSFYIKKLLETTSDIHWKYRYNSTTEHNVVCFDTKHKSNIMIIESNGHVSVLQFNRHIKRKGTCIAQYKLELLKYIFKYKN